MERLFDKIICIVLLCFLSYPFKIVWANDMKSNFEISDPLVLHTLSGHGEFDDYDGVELFADSDNRIVVSSFFVFNEENIYKTKILLFVLNNERWVNSEQILPRIQAWRGMVNNGKFEAYAESDSPEIYGFTSDMKLTTHPIKTIKMDMSKKVFKHENYRHLEKLLPLEEHPDNFFIIGRYRESRLLNPVNFALFLTSAGHWGFVERLYGATVGQNEITGYYSMPEKTQHQRNCE